MNTLRSILCLLTFKSNFIIINLLYSNLLCRVKCVVWYFKQLMCAAHTPKAVYITFVGPFKPFFVDPPASKARREVANLTEGKSLHTPVYGVKEFVCLPVCYTILHVM